MKEKYQIQDFLEIKFAAGGSFSPDGNKIAFLSNLTGTSQLYLTSRTTETTEQLTSYDDTLTLATFSPTKNEIMFGMGKGGDEKTQFYLYDISKKEIRLITNKPNFIHHWGGWSRDGRFIAYASNEINGTDFDIYVMNLETREVRLVFNQGGWCEAMGFSPTGAKIIVVKQHTFLHHDLYLVDLASGTAELLTPHEGKAEYGIPRWLPDESGFFFTNNEGRDHVGLSFYDLRTRKHRYVLTPPWGLEMTTLTLNGRNLAVIANEEGYSRLIIYDAKTLKPIESQTFPNGMIDGIRWSNDGEYLVFNRGAATNNTDLWIWSKAKNECRQITHSPNRVPTEIFTDPELVHYQSFDGLKIPAFIFLPKNTKGKVPAIINIHGGPEGQYRPGFNALAQYFVYHGYAFIAPNVRGSSGYGKKYLALDDIEKRMDSVKDLESLHKYLEGRSEIDSNKIALMGGSYGGYMTLAGLTFYPDLWAAGIDIVGFSNLVTLLENTSPWRRALREAEYGYLKTDRKFLESISPLNFVQNIRAPLLIIHGANDPRVPLSEAQQIYKKLIERGMRVEILIYDDEGHGLAKLKNRLDAYPKIADFLDAWLK